MGFFRVEPSSSSKSQEIRKAAVLPASIFAFSFCYLELLSAVIAFAVSAPTYYSCLEDNDCQTPNKYQSPHCLDANGDVNTTKTQLVERACSDEVNASYIEAIKWSTLSAVILSLVLSGVVSCLIRSCCKSDEPSQEHLLEAQQNGSVHPPNYSAL